MLVALALVLTGVIAVARQSSRPEAPMDSLARRSPELSVALANGRPTLVEFYADWCEACQAMAPALQAVEEQVRGGIDVVLLNVDNPRWQPELDRYEVNGIPQLELFGADGTPAGRSLGARSEQELTALVSALIEDRPLPRMAGVGPSSSLATPDRPEPAGGAAGPRSHG
nr:thioredoxin domain-containing protein [Synechococcus sp. RSCCF101]